MARIAYILLCHKDAEGVIAQARRLTAAGDYVAIHFDGNAGATDFDRIHAALSPNPGVAFAKRRIKCGWGAWSLVEASLLAVRAGVAAFPRATHFYMLSGDCMPIKSAEYAHDFLDREDADYIESFDFFKSDWIKTGIKEERLIYRHWFNERNSKALFYASMMPPESRYYRFSSETPGSSLRKVSLRGRLNEDTLINFKTRDQMLAAFSVFEKLHAGYYETLIREDEGVARHNTFVGRKRA